SRPPRRRRRHGAGRGAGRDGGRPALPDREDPVRGDGVRALRGDPRVLPRTRVHGADRARHLGPREPRNAVRAPPVASAAMQPNRPFETGYAGVGLTYARVPLELDPAGWAGADVVILGAPFDEGVSYRPGTRFGPRAIRQGEDVGAPGERPHMELGIDPYAAMKVLDGGDVDVRAGNLVASHAALQTGVSQVLEAGASAVVLGGDHSLSMPVLRAIA